MCCVLHPPLQHHAGCQAPKSQPEDNFETRHFPLLLSIKPHHGHVVPYLISANFRLMHDKIQKEVSMWCFWLLPKHLAIPHFKLSQNPKGFASAVIPFPGCSVCFLSPCYLWFFVLAHALVWDKQLLPVCAVLQDELLPLDHLGRSVREVKSLRGATRAFPFPHGKIAPGREGGVLAAFPRSFISVILFSVNPQPLPSIWQWMTEKEWNLANQLFPGSCVLDLLPCWELCSRICVRCITSQIQRSILWNPKDFGNIQLYWEHAKRSSDWTIKWLSTEVVQFPSLKVFKSRLDKSWSNLAWSPRWLNLLWTWGGTRGLLNHFQPELSHNEQASFAPSAAVHFWDTMGMKAMHFCRV